jgi:hypothetical protein
MTARLKGLTQSRDLRRAPHLLKTPMCVARQLAR